MSLEKVEMVDIDTLIPFEKNPRKISEEGLEKLKRSIEVFGFVAPVLVQISSNMVVAGHQRLKAARELGIKEVPAVFLDLNDQQALAYNIADNRLGENSSWDYVKLRDLLDELAAEDIEAQLMGFSNVELEAFLDGLDEIDLEKEEKKSIVTCPKCGKEHQRDHLEAFTKQFGGDIDG